MTARPSDEVAPLENVPRQAYPVDVDELAQLLPYVFAELHWGLERVDNQVTALAARGLTLADKPVIIRARQVDRDATAVQIEVGPFGSPEEQAEFHRMLAAIVAEEIQKRP